MTSLVRSLATPTVRLLNLRSRERGEREFTHTFLDLHIDSERSVGYAAKILARVILDRLIPTFAEEKLPKSQCSFRVNRGITDMIFVLRQIQEKCREQNMG
ncbi:hypothetical protein HOLleu_33173 [Holothuria leucospilota]|uniref:Reverse transcriptase domain-containing protein n=1 Tax=Holothuria leucospilota TaxID=206669 RepID=A0A9Q1BH31_HOLLE|nr:hypothetical protein HOLleu_33173 [Holothuria leucospilota]